MSEEKKTSPAAEMHEEIKRRRSLGYFGTALGAISLTVISASLFTQAEPGGAERGHALWNEAREQMIREMDAELTANANELLKKGWNDAQAEHEYKISAAGKLSAAELTRRVEEMMAEKKAADQNRTTISFLLGGAVLGSGLRNLYKARKAMKMLERSPDFRNDG